MAGKKEKSKKKGKQPMSRIGTALFPRAMFAAVPRSPEPPKENTEERPPSALASALLNTTLVGRVIATPSGPSPESTLRTPRHEENGEGSPNQEGGNASLVNSMARSSMYDYDDSEEEEEEEDEEVEEPHYSTVPIRRQNDRSTISNRARLDTPPPDEADTDSDSIAVSDLEEEEDDEHLQLDTSGSRGPSPSTSKGFAVSKSQEHTYLAPRSDERVVTNGNQAPEPKKTEDIYAQPRKIEREPAGLGSSHSPSSSLTGVSSPVDDFSDLITPPPPWKRKKDKKKGGTSKSDRISPRKLKEEHISPVSRMEESTAYKTPVIEPVIEAMQVKSASTIQHAPPNMRDQEQDSYDYAPRPGTSASRTSNAEDEYLRMTNLRLEQELELVQRERQQLLETLQQQTQTLGKLQSVQASLSPSHSMRAPSPTQSRKEMEELQRTLRTKTQEYAQQEAEYSAKLEQLVKQCEKLRKENQATREVNDQLHQENHSLKQFSTSLKDDNGISQRALQHQAEEVMEENEQLKNIIHKLNVQLSRYQAKCSPPQKKDPPGLPARGGTPRWLTDTKYLSPLILAYEDMLQDKQELVQMCQKDLEQLRKGAEDVVQENQRLHGKLDQIGQPSSVTPAEWHQIQEQARLVLEENQVVLTQLDIQQKKLREAHKTHAQEVAKLGKRIAIVEAEKNQVEIELSELQHKYSALKQQHDRTVVSNERKMPIQEHMDTLAEYKRSMDELRHKHETEQENLRSKLTSVQSEKKNLALKLVEMQAEKSQSEGEIKALNKAQKKLSHKLGFLERELEHAEARETAANQHLNKVLAIAEQTVAERDSYEKLAKTQAQEKKKAMNKMMDSNITIGRMEEKLKMYKLRADEKLGQMSMRMENQEGSHTSRLRQYNREVKHLQQLLQDKQDALDSLTTDKRKVEDQLETVWQTATADNKRMKARLAHTMRGSTDGQPFGSDSDNIGLLSSESD